MSIYEIKTSRSFKHKIGFWCALMRVSSKDFGKLVERKSPTCSHTRLRENLVVEVIEIKRLTGEPIAVHQIKGKKINRRWPYFYESRFRHARWCFELVPNAKIASVGLYIERSTLQPVAYFDKVVRRHDFAYCLICWPHVFSNWWYLNRDALIYLKSKRIVNIFLGFVFWVAAP